MFNVFKVLISGLALLQFQSLNEGYKPCNHFNVNSNALNALY